MVRAENNAPRTSRWKRARTAGLLSLVPGLLGLAFVHWPLTSGLEERYGLDLLFKLRGPAPSPRGVCVVAIDTASYLEKGFDPLEPWPRALHGELVQILAQQTFEEGHPNLPSAEAYQMRAKPWLGSRRLAAGSGRCQKTTHRRDYL